MENIPCLQKSLFPRQRMGHDNYYSLISGGLLTICKCIGHQVFESTAPWLSCLASLGTVSNTVLQVTVLCTEMQTPVGTSFATAHIGIVCACSEKEAQVWWFALKMASVVYHFFPLGREEDINLPKQHRHVDWLRHVCTWWAHGCEHDYMTAGGHQLTTE